MNPYYNIDQRRSWARIQSIAKYDPAAGLRMAAAFGRRLAERDMRRAGHRHIARGPRRRNLALEVKA
jgi:ABC-type phosphonate transport system ATPase subunit